MISDLVLLVHVGVSVILTPPGGKFRLLKELSNNCFSLEDRILSTSRIFQSDVIRPADGSYEFWDASCFEYPVCCTLKDERTIRSSRDVAQSVRNT